MAKDGYIKRSTPNSQWFKNVARSLGASTADIITEISPSSSEFVSSNATFLGNSVRNLRGSSDSARQGLKGLIQNNQTLGIGKDAIRNAIADIKSGNINNQEREMEAILGDDGFGDIDLSDSNFSGLSPGTSSDKPSIISQIDMKSTNDNINRSANLVSASITASTKSAASNTQNLINAQEKASATIVSTNKQIAQGVMATLTNIDSNIAKLVTFQSDSMSKYVGASIQYYDQSLTAMNDTMSQIKAMFQAKEQQDVRERDNASERTFLANGGLDLREYMGVVKKNINEAIDANPALQMLKMMMSDTNGLKTLAANPLAGISKALVTKVIPTFLQQSMKTFDKTFSEFFPSMFMKLNRNMDSENPILRGLAQVFGIKTTTRKTVAMDRYERGAIPFDGDTKKAITEVIPSYLRKILSAVSGEKEIAYDHTTGTWDNVENLKQRFITERENTLLRPFDDYMSEIKNMTQAFQTSDRERKDFNEKVDKFFLNLAENGHGANVRDRKSLNKVYDFEGSESMQKLFQNAIQALEKSQQMSMMGKSIFDARAAENRMIEEAERNPLNNNAIHVFNNLGNDKNFDKKGNIIKGSIFNPIDKFGYNSLDYLRQIKRIMLDGLTVYSATPKKPTDMSVTADEIGEDPNRIKLRKMKMEESRMHQEEAARQLRESGFQVLSPSDTKKLAGKGIMPVDSISDLGNMSNSQLQNIMKNYTKMNNPVSDEKTSTIWDWIGKFVRGGKNEKSQLIREKMDDVLQKPAKLVKKLFDHMDETMYDMVFGDPEKGEKGSMMDRMAKGFKRTFDDIGTFAKERVFKPVKDFFTGENGIFKQIAGHDLTKSSKEKMDKVVSSLFGNKGMDGKRTGGMLGVMGDQFLDIGSYAKYMFSGKGYRDRMGKTHNDNPDAFFPTLGGMFKQGAGSVKKYLFGDAEAKDEVNKKGIATTVLNTIQTGLNNWSEGIFGKKVINGEKKKLNAGEIWANVKTKAPKALAKGVAGAAIGTLLASGTGLLGAVFLPGATAALMGGAVGMATESDRFMKTVFGESNNRGERMGGIISKNTQDFFRKNKNVMIGGGILGLSKSMLGIGLLPGIFGGPVAGAALGVAGAMIYRSNKVQDLLFGKMDMNTGKKIGGLFNKSRDMKTKDGKKFKDLLPNSVVGVLGGGAAGVGFSALASQFGLLGAMVSPLGPIGGAALGLAGAIALSSKKFNKMMFGEFDEKTGLKDGGVLTKLSNFFSLEVAAPFKLEMKQVGLNMKKWFVSSIANPFRDAIAPMKAAMNNMMESVTGLFKSGWKAVQGSIAMTFENHVGKPFGEFMRENVADPMKKMLRAILYKPAQFMGNIMAAPFKAMGFVGNQLEKRHERRGIRHMRKNMWSGLRDSEGRRERGERLTLGGTYDADGNRIDEGFLGRIKGAYFDRTARANAKISEDGAYYKPDEVMRKWNRDVEQMDAWEKAQAKIDAERERLAKFRKQGAKAEYDNFMTVAGADGSERKIDVSRFYNLSKFGKAQSRFLQGDAEAMDYSNNFNDVMGISLAELLGDDKADAANLSKGQKKMVRKAMKSGYTGNALRRFMGIDIKTPEMIAAEKENGLKSANAKIISTLPDTIKDSLLESARVTNERRGSQLEQTAETIVRGITGFFKGNTGDGSAASIVNPTERTRRSKGHTRGTTRESSDDSEGVQSSSTGWIDGEQKDPLVRLDIQHFGKTGAKVSPRQRGLIQLLSNIWTKNKPLPVYIVGAKGSSSSSGGSGSSSGSANGSEGMMGGNSSGPGASMGDAANVMNAAKKGTVGAVKGGINTVKGFKGAKSAIGEAGSGATFGAKAKAGFGGFVGAFKSAKSTASGAMTASPTGMANKFPSILKNGSIKLANLTGGLRRNDPAVYGGANPEYATRRNVNHILGERAEQAEIIERAMFRSSTVDFLSQIESNTRRTWELLEDLGGALGNLGKRLGKALGRFNEMADNLAKIPEAMSDMTDRLLDKMDEIIEAIMPSDGDGGYGDGSSNGGGRGLITRGGGVGRGGGRGGQVGARNGYSNFDDDERRRNIIVNVNCSDCDERNGKSGSSVVATPGASGAIKQALIGGGGSQTPKKFLTSTMGPTMIGGKRNLLNGPNNYSMLPTPGGKPSMSTKLPSPTPMLPLGPNMPTIGSNKIPFNPLLPLNLQHFASAGDGGVGGSNWQNSGLRPKGRGGIFGSLGRGGKNLVGGAGSLATDIGISLGIMSVMNNGVGGTMDNVSSFFSNTMDGVKESSFYKKMAKAFNGEGKDGKKSDRVAFKDSNLHKWLTDEGEGINKWFNDLKGIDVVTASLTKIKDITKNMVSSLESIASSASNVWEDIKNLDGKALKEDLGDIGSSIMDSGVLRSVAAGALGLGAYKTYRAVRNRNAAKRLHDQDMVATNKRENKYGLNTRTHIQDKARRRTFRETMEDARANRFGLTREGRLRSRSERQDRRRLRNEAKNHLRDYDLRQANGADTHDLDERYMDQSRYDRNGNIRREFRAGKGRYNEATGRYEYDIKELNKDQRKQQEMGAYYKGKRQSGEFADMPYEAKYHTGTFLQRTRAKMSPDYIRYKDAREDFFVHDAKRDGVKLRRSSGIKRALGTGFGAATLAFDPTGGLLSSMLFGGIRKNNKAGADFRTQSARRARAGQASAQPTFMNFNNDIPLMQDFQTRDELINRGVIKPTADDKKRWKQQNGGNSEGIVDRTKRVYNAHNQAVKDARQDPEPFVRDENGSIVYTSDRKGTYVPQKRTRWQKYKESYRRTVSSKSQGIVSKGFLGHLGDIELEDRSARRQLKGMQGSSRMTRAGRGKAGLLGKSIGVLGKVGKGKGGILSKGVGMLGKGAGALGRFAKSGGLRTAGKFAGLLGKNALKLGGSVLGGVGIAAGAAMGGASARSRTNEIFNLKEGEKATKAQKNAATTAGSIIGAIPFADMLDEALGGKITSFIADLALKFGGVFDKIKDSTTKTAKSIGTAISKPFTAMYKSTKEVFGKAKEGTVKLIKNIGSVMSKSVKAIYKVTKDVFVKSNKAVASAFKKVGSKIASVSKAIYTKTKSVFDKSKKAVTSSFGKVWSKISSVVKAIYTKTKSVFDKSKEVVSDKFTAAYNKVKDAVLKIYTTTKEKFDSAKKVVSDKFTQVKTTVRDKVTAIYTTVKDKMTDTVTAVKDKFGSIKDKVREIAGNIMDAILDPLRGVAGTISDKFSVLQDKAASALSKTWDFVTGGGKTRQPDPRYGAGDVDNNGDVYYSQKDPRWANQSLAGGGGLSFGDAGCGPTAASMLVNSIKAPTPSPGFGAGNATITYGAGKAFGAGAPKLPSSPKPTDALQFAQAGGFVDKNKGTRSDFFNMYSAANGIATRTQDNPTAAQLKQELAMGNKVVLRGIGGRNYTNSGHYIVATGLTKDGQVSVKDPLSKSRSGNFDAASLTQNATTAIIADGGAGFGAGNARRQAMYAMGGISPDFDQLTTDQAGEFMGDRALPDTNMGLVDAVRQQAEAEEGDTGLGGLFGAGSSKKVSGDDLFNYAKKFKGYRYQWGGTNPKTSFDCSGLIMYSMQKLGKKMVRTSREQYKFCTPVHSSNVRVGDLVFFAKPASGSYQNIYHVGIVGKNGTMINAQNRGVLIEDIRSPWWKGTIYGYGRVPGIAPGQRTGGQKSVYGDRFASKKDSVKDKITKASNTVKDTVKKAYTYTTKTIKTLAVTNPFEQFTTVAQGAFESLLAGKKTSTAKLKALLYNTTTQSVKKAVDVATSGKSSGGSKSKTASPAKIKLSGGLRGYETAIKEKVTELIGHNEGGGYFYAANSGITSKGRVAPDMGIFHWRESTAADVSSAIYKLNKKNPYGKEFSTSSAWRGGPWSNSKVARFKKFLNYDKDATKKAQNQKASSRVEMMMGQTSKGAPNIKDPKQFAVLTEWLNTGNHAYSLKGYRGGNSLSKFKNYFKSNSFWFRSPGLAKYRNGYSNRLNYDVSNVSKWKPVYAKGGSTWGGGKTKATPMATFGAGNVGKNYSIHHNVPQSRMVTPVGMKSYGVHHDALDTIRVNASHPVTTSFVPSYGSGYVQNYNTHVYGSGETVNLEGVLVLLQQIVDNTLATAQNVKEIVIPDGTGGTAVVPVVANSQSSSVNPAQQNSLNAAMAIARAGRN